MDPRKIFRMKMEKALELFNLVEALSHVDSLITTASCADVSNLLRNHTLRDLPTFHYLAGFPYREEDLPHLERLIRIFTDFGYDINKTLPRGVRRRTSHSITALLASVKKQNVILVECLLRCGANPNIRDRRGLSPCHWAIKKGNLKCLEKLLEHGALVTSYSGSSSTRVLPLLHEAVDYAHLDIVLYLLGKEELGVDLNEKALYNHFPERYHRWCTPLRMAVYKEATPIIQALINHPGSKPCRFQELHYFLKNGPMKMAFDFLKYFTDEDLSTDKIGDQWPLHTLDYFIFSNPSFVECTKEIILEYVRRGWDPNSVSSAPKRITFEWDERPDIVITKYNLLHLACLYNGHEIIKLLVEGFGVDIQRNMEGRKQLELTPLQILLTGEQWHSAKYLIEKGADVNVRGTLGMLESPEFRIRSMRRNLSTGELEMNSGVNAVELLVRMGDEDALPLLDQLLARPDVVLQGAFEFHLALEGMNPIYVAEVVRRCSKMISKEDLNWVTFWNGSGEEPEKVPSLVWLFDTLFGRREWEDVDALADLIKLMAQLGYDLNSVGDLDQSLQRLRAPLIFYILKNDMDHQTSDYLLRTILQFDHLQLNVTDPCGYNPVDFLLNQWGRDCRKFRQVCWKRPDLQHPPILETVNLLLAHGLDVSEMVIGPNFTYHGGFNLIIKVLYRAGAKISEEFFTNPNLCLQGSRRIGDAVFKQIAELKEWKDAFDQETGLSLKHISGLRVRKMIKCVGDLKMLDELPGSLKKAVLGTCGVSASLMEHGSSPDERSDL